MLARLRSRLSARLHTWFGLRNYRAGRLARAARHFARAMSIDPTGGHAFDAHLHLGRIFLRIGELARGQDELRAARFEDGVRFERECRTEEALLDLLAKLEADSGNAPRGRAAARCRDDFSSDGERARFSSLPPIHAAEIDEIDWESLAAQLAD